MSDEVENMFSVKLTPWHGKGIVLDSPPTSEEAIQRAGLDWEVVKRDVFWKDKDGQMEEICNRVALVRRSREAILDECLLSVVSKQYNILQNKDAFGFFDPIIEGGFAEYETAGSLMEGRKIWILAKLKDTFHVGHIDDEIRQYVLLCNGHDGATGVMVQPTPIRVVCNNTLQMSLGHGLVQTFGHRGNLQADLDEAKKLLGFTREQFERIKKSFFVLENTALDSKKVEQFLKHLIPDAPLGASDRIAGRVEDSRDKICELLHNGSNASISMNQDTMWALYNAAIEFVDFYNGKRCRDRANYQLFGQGAAMKRNAYDLAIKISRGEEL